MKLRVVADTNVYISGLIYGGLPRSFFDEASISRFTLILSPEIRDELDRKLREKFNAPIEDLDETLSILAGFIELVNPTLRVKAVPDDPDDNKILECAVEGRADVIVSGDRHLLRLRTYQGIPIITIRQLLERLPSSHTTANPLP